MHHVLRRASRGVGCCLLAVAFVPAFAAAQLQRPSLTAVALNTLMDFRAHWMGDSTRFDACSVYRALGSPADFSASGLLPQVQTLLDRASDPCAEDPSRATVQSPLNFVRVDSIAISGDSTARVHLTVWKRHEQRYFETYDLGGLNRGPLGWVGEVRVWGMARIYPVRPGGLQPPP